MPSAPINLRPFRHRLALAPAVLAGVLAIGLAGGPGTSAQTAQLDGVRAEQDRVRAQLAEQNAAVNVLLGQVFQLRQREDAVAAQLAEQEAKLAAARRDLAEARDALADTKRRLRGATDELERLLVSIYRSGEPDVATLFLDSEDVNDLWRRDRFTSSASRTTRAGWSPGVRDLRAAASAHVNEVETSIERMEAARAAIAKRQQALAASRATLEQRESALRAAQQRRREQLADLQGEAQSLVEALSKPAPDPGARGRRRACRACGPTRRARADGGPRSTPTARRLPRRTLRRRSSTRSPPRTRSPTHRTRTGAGTAPFESSGYDCSGSVSFALHGGGLLSSPLDSTGFMTWGESGPGRWITVYSKPGHAYVVIVGPCASTPPAVPDRAGRVPATPPVSSPRTRPATQTAAGRGANPGPLGH